MSAYLLFKYIHIGCAITSFCGFALRGYWMVIDSSLRQHRLAKILPHIIDTVLLASAIALVIISRQYPWVAGWVALKIILLLVYIVLGTFALKRGKTRVSRIRHLVAALLAISLIFATALFKPVIGI